MLPTSYEQLPEEEKMSQITVEELAQVNLADHNKADVYQVCGWWDWFCSESSLVNRSKPFISLAKRLSSNWRDVGLFLKNNCPFNGPTYDSIALQNGEGNNIFWCEKRDGVWTVTYVPDSEEVFECKTVKQLADWLNTEEAPR